jgi:hypothetical protein
VTALSFPVLYVNGPVARVADDEETFNRVHRRVARTKAWFDGQLVVDSLLNGYRVDHAQLTGESERGLLFMRPRFVTVRRIYREGPFPTTLDEVKNAVQAAIAFDRDVWEELGNVTDVAQAIAQAASFAQLCDVLREPRERLLPGSR